MVRYRDVKMREQFVLASFEPPCQKRSPKRKYDRIWIILFSKSVIKDYLVRHSPDEVNSSNLDALSSSVAKIWGVKRRMEMASVGLPDLIVIVKVSNCHRCKKTKKSCRVVKQKEKDSHYIIAGARSAYQQESVGLSSFDHLIVPICNDYPPFIGLARVQEVLSICLGFTVVRYSVSCILFPVCVHHFVPIVCRK